MRFVTFSDGGAPRAGVFEGEWAHSEASVIDLSHPAFSVALEGQSPDILAFVQTGISDVATRLAKIATPDDARLQARTLRFHAPISAPPCIYGIAFNFHCALAERKVAIPSAPVVFMKDPETVIGPDDPIVLPKGIGGVTYEAELAVVIGTGGHRIARQDALDHVAGYVAFNDISASEMIKADGNFVRGKNQPTFGPLGPMLVTREEIADPQDLAISLSVDGVMLQSSSTSEMVFTVRDLISILSRDKELLPGTIIATGTPAGVAPVRNPHTWLQPGMQMEMFVSGLGSLRNPVVEAPR